MSTDKNPEDLDKPLRMYAEELMKMFDTKGPNSTCDRDIANETCLYECRKCKMALPRDKVIHLDWGKFICLKCHGCVTGTTTE